MAKSVTYTQAEREELREALAAAHSGVADWFQHHAAADGSAAEWDTADDTRLRALALSLATLMDSSVERLHDAITKR